MYSTAEPSVAVEVTNNSAHYDVHGGVTRLPDIPDVPYLDTVAVLNKAKDRLTLFCVNRHLTQDIPARIVIAGFTAQGAGIAQTIRAGGLYEGNDEVQPEHVKPEQSTVMVEHGEVQYTFRHASVTRIDFQAQ